MKPRLDVVALNQSASFAQLLQLVREKGYSRIPIFKDDLDEVQGIIYSKDLIEHLEKDENFKWNILLRDVLYIPENKKIDDLLALFKKRRMHFAIVINEYGGTEGIVTLEDVLEVVIGDINDEFDEDKQTNIKKINTETFQINARTPLHEICKYFDISRDYLEESEEIDTLGGFMLILFKRIPNKGEEINYKSFSFYIESVDKNRIENIKVIVKP
jgi:CBS domain containing-hemolysin-like protein